MPIRSLGPDAMSSRELRLQIKGLRLSDAPLALHLAYCQRCRNALEGILRLPDNDDWSLSLMLGAGALSYLLHLRVEPADPHKISLIDLHAFVTGLTSKQKEAISLILDSEPARRIVINTLAPQRDDDSSSLADLPTSSSAGTDDEASSTSAEGDARC